MRPKSFRIVCTLDVVVKIAIQFVSQFNKGRQLETGGQKWTEIALN